MISVLYKIYQLVIGLPLLVILTIVTALEVGIGTTIGNGHFWGYYPGHWWGKLILKLFLIPVKVEGSEHLEKGQSYVFVANHQGAFDIFLIYGHLNRNFKWMMKQSLRKIPFVGYACEKSHQIFVDKRGPSKIRKTYETLAEEGADAAGNPYSDSQIASFKKKASDYDSLVQTLFQTYQARTGAGAAY